MKKHLILLSFLSLLLIYGCSKDEIDPQEDNSESNSSGSTDEETEKDTSVYYAEQSDYQYVAAQISITTDSSVTRDTYISCSIKVTSDNSAWCYSGTGKICGRGNSSWEWYDKKPYKIKLDNSTKLLGMGKNKDWNFLANYRDPTNLMNTYVFECGRVAELPFTNHTRYATVSLNGKNIGLYQITEKVEIAKSRVAIDETNGYLIALDRDDGPELSPDDGDNFWSEVYNLPVCVKSSDVSPAVLSAVKADFKKVEDAIYNRDYSALKKVLDVKSFIKFLIIQELVYNVEVDAPRSMYFYKDPSGLWSYGPLWDFDAGYDFDWSNMYTGHDYFSSYKELVLGTDPVNHTAGYQVNDFFTSMFADSEFKADYQAMWISLKDKFLNEAWTETYKYYTGCKSAFEDDSKVWPKGKDCASQISTMKTWLNNRATYLSQVIADY